MKNRFIVAAVALAFSATGAMAATFDGLIDFSEFNNGDVVSQIDLGGGVLVDVEVENGQNGDTGIARIFDTSPTPADPNMNNSNDPDLVADPFLDSAAVDPLPGRGFGNALIIQERDNFAAPNGGPDDEQRGGVIFFDFGDVVVDLMSLFYLDGEEGFSIVANMDEIDNGSGSDDMFSFIDFSDKAGAKGLSRFAVVFNGSGAIGELEVQLNAVPVPAGLPLVLTGFGAFAFLRRKRRAA